MSVIIAANRTPIRSSEEGWLPAVGGLATALLPVLEEHGGIWVSMQEEETAPDRQPYPVVEPRFTVRRIPVSEDEMANYYLGMANSVLWPTAHYMHHLLSFSRSYVEDYRAVNQRFADVILEEARDGDTVWVHDYHLMLVPEFVRQKRPDLKIGFFWHIPWPAMEVYRILPWARELLQGMLACDLIGFHVAEYVDNFVKCARILLGAEQSGAKIQFRGRSVRVESHPIGIDVQQFERLARGNDDGIVELREEIGTEYLILGVDRLDYTKGMLERLRAFEQLLTEKPELHGRVSFFQVATPSRTEVDSYRQLKREVDETVGRTNGAFARANWLPVRYRYRTYTPEELSVLYRSADVMLITPIRDGMNLVAHEFVASSSEGALVLSELTGAAYLMPEAIQVNPFDQDGIVQAMIEAMEMPVEEKRLRLQQLKKTVADLDVHQWAARFLTSLARG